MTPAEWTYGLTGLGLGATIAFFFLNAKAARLGLEKFNLEKSQASLEASHQSLQTHLAEMKAKETALTGKAETLQNAAMAFQAEKAGLESKVETLTRQLKEQKEAFEKEWSEKFEILSSRTLNRVTEQLEDKAKREYQERQELLNKDISTLLAPITKLVKENEIKVQALGEQTIKETASLKKQLELSFQQTKDLIEAKNRIVTVLSDNKRRGDWGEQQLIRILEMSGLIRDRDYIFQQAQDDQSRPDVRINLPNGHILYIDVKTLVGKLDQYQANLEAIQTESERKTLTDSLRTEILKLSGKAYQGKHKASIDFVILYVPRESMLRIPLEEYPALMDDAFEKGIVLCSPLILMGLLKTIAAGWQDARKADTAREIVDIGKKLQACAGKFLVEFDKMGKAIDSLSRKYGESKQMLTGGRGFTHQLNKISSAAQSANMLPEQYRLPETIEIQGEEDLRSLDISSLGAEDEEEVLTPI